jgi:uncharacterized RDD family membrane protein YckC
MIRSRLLIASVVTMVTLWAGAPLAVQNRPSPSAPPPSAPSPARPAAPAQAPAPPMRATPPAAPEAAAAPDRPETEFERSLRREFRSAVRVGGSYSLGPNDVVGDVALVVGDASIEGRPRDVVVELGGATLGATAVVDGSLTVIGGPVRIAPGARIRRDITVVGGTLDAPPELMAGGDRFVLDRNAFGGWFDPFFMWVTRGLLWGRLMVPSLPWLWAVAALVFFLSIAFLAVFNGTVRAAADTASMRPFSALLVGLLVLVLVGPLCVLLAASVIGIPVVPFVICGLLFSAFVGRIAIMRSIGRLFIREGDPESRGVSVRSFALGFVLVLIAYMIPVLGLVTWTMVGMFGIGAAMLAFVGEYRRENPAPPPVRVMPTIEPPAVPPAGFAPAGAAAAPFDAESYGGAPFVPSSAVVSSTAVTPAVPGSVPISNRDLLSFPRATFFTRIAAGILDVVLVIILTQILDDFDHMNVFFLLLLAYIIGFWGWKGTTVGGIICQLRVVRVDGAPLRFVDALVRGLSSVFSALVLGLGFLWILRDPERQAWQDKIAGTFVVRVPRHYPI